MRVAPSILSADFGRLREQVGEVLAAGARVIHVDVMDGHFVPPITVGPLVVEGARRAGRATAGAMLDVHLMIERPERHVAEFVKAGADSITFHAEATPHVAYAASLIRESGACVGVAINPGTPVGALAGGRRRDRPGAVHDGQPGLGRAAVHRALARQAPARARDRRRAASRSRSTAASTPTRRRAAAQAGANVFVAGSAIFGAADPGRGLPRDRRSVASQAALSATQPRAPRSGACPAGRARVSASASSAVAPA